MHDADAISAETMAAVARETNLSETTFVQTADQQGADYRNRILTIGGEVPFAGHPSLGTAVAVARQRGLDRAEFVQQTGSRSAARLGVSQPASHWHASMLQDPAQFGAEPDPAEVMALAGLDGGLADRRAASPVRVDRDGAPDRPRSRALRRSPRRRPISRRSRRSALRTAATPSTWSGPMSSSGRVRARMFSQFVPGGEDPGTGSAAGPLCAYLNARARLERIEISQGSEIGRPCSIEARIEGDGVRVGGDVAVAVDGMIQLP